MNFPKLLLTVVVVTALNISVSFASAPQSVVTSPNGAVKIVVTQNESSPTYSVSFNGAAVLNESKTGLKFKDVDQGTGASRAGEKNKVMSPNMPDSKKPMSNQEPTLSVCHLRPTLPGYDTMSVCQFRL